MHLFSKKEETYLILQPKVSSRASILSSSVAEPSSRARHIWGENMFTSADHKKESPSRKTEAVSCYEHASHNTGWTLPLSMIPGKQTNCVVSWSNLGEAN